MKPKLENLFVYGTLRDPITRRKVIGRDVECAIKRLRHYRHSSTNIDGQTFPIIEPVENSWVSGEVFSLTEEELKRVDAYEGPRYCRKLHELADGTKAFVYTLAK